MLSAWNYILVEIGTTSAAVGVPFLIGYYLTYYLFFPAEVREAIKSASAPLGLTTEESQRITVQIYQAEKQTRRKYMTSIIILISLIIILFLITLYGSIVIIDALVPLGSEHKYYTPATVISSFGTILSGLSVGILPGVLLSRYMRLAQIKQARFALDARKKIVSSIDESRLRDVSYARQAQIERDEYRYKENLSSVWVIKSVELHKTCIFPDISWNLEPGVNVLLGRNGFGKSLLLRLLVGALTYDDDCLSAMSSNRDPEQTLTVGLLRNGEPALIERDQKAFVESVGKIPVLAIPDSRFINRARDSVNAEGDDKADPARDGARHFLYELPYETRLQTVLTQMCIEYVNSRPRGGSSRKWLSTPQLDLISGVIRQLADDEQFYFVRIEPIGNARFLIEVETDASPGRPIAIQHASQGTLSVVAIFALIYQFLRAIYPSSPESQICNQPAIVIIDEVDAHLHPAWQRKITDLLRKQFPRVQFVLTAHSPLVVAGCRRGEVALLRREDSDFRIVDFQRDFIGAMPEDIYRLVFELEERDVRFLELQAQVPQLPQLIRDLESKKRQTDADVSDLEETIEAIKRTKEEQKTKLTYEALHQENEQLRRQLGAVQRKSEGSGSV